MADLAAGEMFGPYRVVTRLGAGGMGAVWEAQDTSHGGRLVALKVLLPPSDADDESAVETARARFQRECALAASLNSPHVVPIYDYGQIDGQLYIVMARLHGTDLGALLRAQGHLPPVRAVAIVGQVARALSTAHRAGLVHRDVKPPNIVVTDDGEGGDHVYLIDFGIAWAASATRITYTGIAPGTLAYMAPEQLDSRRVDQRADVYALACVLYQALTGRPPFSADHAAQLIYAHFATPPPLPSHDQVGVPPGLDAVIACGMAKDPAHRYLDTAGLAAAARAALTATRTASPPQADTKVLPSPILPGGPPSGIVEQSDTSLPMVQGTPSAADGISRRAVIRGLIGGAVVVVGGGATLLVLSKNRPLSLPSTTSATTAAPYPPIADFARIWRNVDPNTRSWVRVEITVQGDALTAHFFGACSPTPCDDGSTSTSNYRGNPVHLHADDGFATRDHTLSLSEDALHITTFTHFTDNSGRVDYTSENDFIR